MQADAFGHSLKRLTGEQHFQDLIQTVLKRLGGAILNVPMSWLGPGSGRMRR